ncbi:hypothetical protein [Pseudonocardia sp. WMMC193]|uniref:hypothetical protein n=1 Tax=Pseudonocardia sp. WMMC193 TaxID=2911965 RepID=UPI001F26BC8D|nr:hypothetical protein [Pseudonocardia sp. WMMC193]MCF7552794.1 hypothetical protein [Pseudonocardia sp. WMMC193]
MVQNPRRPQPRTPDAQGSPPLPRSGAAQRPGGTGPSGRRPEGPRSGGQGPAGQVPGGRRPGRSTSGAGPTHVLGAHRTLATTTVTEPEKKKVDLTLTKVAAGAAAAATSAVAGSYLGAAGTVAGAAIGSVVTTIATTMYQRSLDKTRETVLQRVKLPGRGAADTTVLAEPVDPLATIPMQRDGGLVAPVLPAPEQRPWYTRKRVWVTAATTVVAFAVGLLVITGVEWAKGSPISGGESGTSVGRVVTGGSAPSEEPRSETTESPTPTTTEQAPESSSGSGSGSGSGSTEQTGGASATRTTTPSPSTSPTTSRAPGTGNTGPGFGLLPRPGS